MSPDLQSHPVLCQLSGNVPRDVTQCRITAHAFSVSAELARYGVVQVLFIQQVQCIYIYIYIYI